MWKTDKIRINRTVDFETKNKSDVFYEIYIHLKYPCCQDKMQFSDSKRSSNVKYVFFSYNEKIEIMCHYQFEHIIEG